MPDTSFHILIAEDNAASRTMMSSILKAKGHRVAEAADGDAAWALTCGQNFDLMLIDINMEPAGGFEFAKKVRQNSINTPIIAITGEDPSSLMVRAAELGIQQILEKPVLPERLIHVATSACQAYQTSGDYIHTGTASTDPQDLVLRAIELALKTASTGKGRPFAAIITDRDGNILAESGNVKSDNFDPLASAEINVIRKAAQDLRRMDLSDCTLYCSFKPHPLAQATIKHVKIKHVFYALAPADLPGTISPDTLKDHNEASYTQICLDEARRAFSIS